MAKAITNSELAQDIAVLKSEVASGHDALRLQLDAGYNLILEKLKPLDVLKTELSETRKTVERQGRAIAWVYGVGATITVGAGGLWTVLKNSHK